jgi:LPPG:FO 2-phospho-L-lactate transferase
VRTDAGWRPFQEFMIRDRGAGTVREVAFDGPTNPPIAAGTRGTAPADPGAAGARPSAPPAAPTPEALAALRDARAVIVGPSNPVISIWPILRVLGAALDGLAAPIVCVSPVVAGGIVKGPTAAFLAAYGQPVTATGVVSFYERVHPGLIDGVVADEPVSSPPALQIDTAMADTGARARVAEQTLGFVLSLA